jgi:hypothetical protein
MTAVPDDPIEACPQDRPDYFAIADHLVLGEIPSSGECTRMSAPERRLLQPVWDGDSEEPALVERARKICATCPVLVECRRFAAANLIEHGFLAGMPAAQRRDTWTRRDRVALRRHKVGALHREGAAVADMMEVLKTPRRTIEADIKALGLNGSRRRNRRAPHAGSQPGDDSVRDPGVLTGQVDRDDLGGDVDDDHLADVEAAERDLLPGQHAHAHVAGPMLDNGRPQRWPGGVGAAQLSA